MQKFELVLKNDRIKAYKTFILFFIALNLIFLIVLATTTQDISTRSKSLLALFITIFSLATEYYLRKKNKQYSGKGAALFYFVLVYLLLQYWWMALGVIVVAIFYAVSLRNLIVYVNPDQIIYPSFPRKILKWSDLNNIILKDGLLTIDFKTNKLAQAEVNRNDNDSAMNEEEFNDFCRNHLKLAGNTD
ncbi:MAG: hypothetical protein ACXWWD_05690 [Chitinophagaceae bacterium]